MLRNINNIKICDGYNKISQEKSKKNIDISNFNIETTHIKNINIDIENIKNFEILNEKLKFESNGSFDINLFPSSSLLKSIYNKSFETKLNTTYIVCECTVIIKKEIAILNNNDLFLTKNDISNIGTSFFSENLYGGFLYIIMEIEKKCHENNDDYDISNKIEINNKPIDFKLGINYYKDIMKKVNSDKISIKCKCDGGSINKVPQSPDEIFEVISYFINSVTENTSQIIKREISDYINDFNIQKMIECYQNIKLKKEILILNYKNDDIINDIEKIMYSIKNGEFDDIKIVNDKYNSIIKLYPDIYKIINKKQFTKIDSFICFGNSRTGKSQLLTTSITNFDPKIAIGGHGTHNTNIKEYKGIKLIDTPGLYEVDLDETAHNVKEIEKGVKESTKNVGVCFVMRDHSGIADHTDLTVLSRMSYSLRNIFDDKNNPITISIVINFIRKRDMKNYITKEHLVSNLNIIAKAIKALDGEAYIKHIILVQDMDLDQEVLNSHMEKLLNFLLEVSSPNKLKFEYKLNPKKSDINKVFAVLQSATSGLSGFITGASAATAYDSIVVFSSGLGPVVCFIVVGAAAGYMVYKGIDYIKKINKKESNPGIYKFDENTDKPEHLYNFDEILKIKK